MPLSSSWSGYRGKPDCKVPFKNYGANFVPTRHNDTYALIDPSKADLSGKYVLVTGASKGIGRAIAISYARAGASGIAILARSDQRELASELVSVAKESGRAEPQILALSVDVTDRVSVDAAAAKLDKEFARLDILINNAGYLENFVPIIKSDPDEWWKTFEINVKGVYLMDRAFLPILLKGGEKTIIVVSSLGAHLTSPGASSYQCTKSTVLRLNNFLMSDHGKEGLIAFGIHPGGVPTDLANNMPMAMRAYLNDTPELAGDTVVFLTKERREWLADRYVNVQWDMQELLDKKDEIISNDLLKVKMRV